MRQVLIGASLAATCQNLVNAINSDTATRGIGYSLPTWENSLLNADAPERHIVHRARQGARQGFDGSAVEDMQYILVVCGANLWRYNYFRDHADYRSDHPRETMEASASPPDRMLSCYSMAR